MSKDIKADQNKPFEVQTFSLGEDAVPDRNELYQDRSTAIMEHEVIETGFRRTLVPGLADMFADMGEDEVMQMVREEITAYRQQK